MKKLKNIFVLTLAVGVGAFSMTSCNESFLDEQETTKLTTQYFDTPEGLMSMALGLPNIFRLHSAHEYGYPMTNYGTDEFTVGSDAAGEPWNNYDSRLQSTVTSSSNTTQPQHLWDMCWISLNTANTIINKVPTVLTGADANTTMGEACFVRGWIYFWMLQQWGGVPLLLEPVTGLQREYSRASVEEVLTQVIEDFQTAYNNLSNPATRTLGKIYKDAAAHYLAKALVYRQCEINAGAFSATQTADLAEALRLCNEVISHRTLATNFMDLWDYNGPDGPEEKLDEILLSAQYTSSTNSANGRYSNMLCLQFVSIYQNWTGMYRNLEGGREYARLRTTDYSMDVYDRVNDSRFWKSFRTTQTVNRAIKRNNSYKGAMENFQVGVMYIINDADDASRFQLPADAVIDRPGATAAFQPPFILMWDGVKYDSIRSKILLPDGPGAEYVVPNVMPRHRVKASDPNADTYAYSLVQLNSIWPTMSKYLDGARTSYNTESSQRDVIKARLAETYLMAAEIKVRQGDYQGALEYINTVRQRAQYKSGEDRAQQKHGGQAYTEDGWPTEWTSRPSSFCPVNTYYVSNNIPVTTAATDLTVTSTSALPAVDEAIISKLGYSSEYDRMLCFVLNERSRELMGELLRWEDLARTKTLIKRAYAFNSDTNTSGTLQEHHYRRPIPLSFLEEVWKDGKPLTAEERSAMQNPGYN